MIKKLIDLLLDKATDPSKDFWRGLVYLLAGLGIVLSPENASTLISVAFVISGVLHTIWHKFTGTK